LVDSLVHVAMCLVMLGPNFRGHMVSGQAVNHDPAWLLMIAQKTKTSQSYQGKWLKRERYRRLSALGNAFKYRRSNENDSSGNNRQSEGSEEVGNQVQQQQPVASPPCPAHGSSREDDAMDLELEYISDNQPEKMLIVPHAPFIKFKHCTK